jgi:Protein of unknown function (DUF2905)
VIKWLIALGLILVAVGLLWPVLGKFGLGRLPGDIFIRRGGYGFYFPVTSCLVVSLVISIIIWIFRR